MKYKQIKLLRISLFFFLATSLSALFRFKIIDPTHNFDMPKWQSELVSALLVGFGVWLAAWISRKWLTRHKKLTISLLGTKPKYSLLMALVPVLLLAITGVQNQYALPTHAWGFTSIVATLLYCMMEEYGWRGYLQEELESVKPWARYSIIGILWYTWHLSFIGDSTLVNQLIVLSMLILGSIGLGEVVRYTKSILVAACFHLLIQIMFFNTFLRNSISGQEKLIVFGILLSSWLIILKLWQKKDTKSTTKAHSGVK
jgi:membrane protease YdiL (CAAX protease family)